MIVYESSEEAIERAAERTGIYVHIKAGRDERTLVVTLEQEPGEQYSTGGGGVCFHGHAAFIKSLLQDDQQAVIRTRAGVYKGWEGFCKEQARISSGAVRRFAKSQSCACR